MYYFDVWPATQRFHGDGGLTYSFNKELSPGTLVLIELKAQVVTGVIVAKVNKPTFKTKPIVDVLDIKPLPTTSIELLKWISGYYPAPLGTIISQFMPTGIKPRVFEIQGIENEKKFKLPPLGSDQSKVLKLITKSKNKSFLLHGDTGTGKTRVYIELSQKSIQNGQSALILTPEIGLTPQLVREFSQVFGTQVMIIHSNLTPKERQESWLRILNSDQPLIVIGPRSALFAPFNKLGLVVIDEAHDNAYKQEQAPYYQAIRVAGQLAKLHSAQLIIGSATPNVTDYYIAESKQVPVLRMKQLVVNSMAKKPKFDIVDSRDKQQFKRSHIISEELIKNIENTTAAGQQSLVFLNRRGSARLVMCQNCGWQALCPNCDLPLTYHGDHHNMRCHTCGFASQAPNKCPVCTSMDIIYKTAGTKTVVEDLVKFFPKEKIQRFDTDNKKADKFEQHYEKISNGEVDILVGTQIITKGLDLPKLGLVGVLAADSSLSFPDYTAQERTFQQLTQILGRVGRGHGAGKAIIQTYHPDSPIIKAAIDKDWQGFYQNELEERRKFMFPPFCYLLKLTVRRKTIKASQLAAEKFANELIKSSLKIKVVGPAPSFYEKSKQGYAWQIIVKAKDRSQLIEVIKSLPSGWSYDIDPASLL